MSWVFRHKPLGFCIFLLLLLIQVQTLTSSSPTRPYTIYAGITGVAGLSSALLYRPAALAINSQQRVFIADTYNNRIVTKGPSNNELLETYGEMGELDLSSPYGIVFDRHDNLYISDFRSHLIKKINNSTREVGAHHLRI